MSWPRPEPPCWPSPRATPVWGLVGYAVFTAGAVAELLGYGIRVALSVPGGLFEVALGIALLARGFPPGADAAAPGIDDNGARQPANRP